VTVRVGHIEFLNCYPLYYGLRTRGVLAAGGEREAGRPEGAGRTEQADFELLPGVPTDLNRMLMDGSIDFGPISSMAYGLNHRRLVLSDRLSISSFGAVDSIQLVTRAPVTGVRTVALTGKSATSVALLKILMKLRFQQQIEYRPLMTSAEEALRTHDAVLLIGDEGLDALYFPLAGTTCHDLGALWQEWTGLPMVYAVWAARDDFVQENIAELLAIEEELVRSIDFCRTHPEQVVQSASGQYRFEQSSLTRYFDVLHYGFATDYRLGLQRFFELARLAGELPEVPVLRFLRDVPADAGGSLAAGSPAAAPLPAVAGAASGPTDIAAKEVTR
jgi:chorismate dehydratase